MVMNYKRTKCVYFLRKRREEGKKERKKGRERKKERKEESNFTEKRDIFHEI
jgi:hypothetical protein